MAVQSDTSSISYTGNNSTVTTYAVPFVFLENSHLAATAKVIATGVETAVTLTNHTGAGDANGGTVRTAVAVPATSTLTIFRTVPATQTTTYQEGGDFPAASHERALDKLTFLAQQNQRRGELAIRVTEASGVKNAVGAAANTFLGFDSSAQPTTMTPAQANLLLGGSSGTIQITNADVAANAAIAGTKIAPNFGSQNVVTTGNVGIGTTSAQDNLHVAGTNAIVRLQDTDTIANGSNSLATFVRFSDSNNNQAGFVGFGGGPILDLWNSTSSSVRIGTNDTERMRIDSNGRVGIGTTSAADLLHVKGTAAAVGDYQIVAEGAAGGYGAGISFQSQLTGGSLAEMARITADGEAAWNTTTTTQDAGLRFYTSSDGTVAEKMRIDSSGNVGIGTTTPSSRLHIAGDLTVSSATTATAATAGTNGDVPAQVEGYLVVSINGTSRKIPYYAT